MGRRHEEVTMPFWSKRGGVATAVGVTALAGALLTVPAAAAAGRVTLAGSVPPWATSAAFAGAAQSNGNVGFRVYLGWRSSPAGLDRAVSTPGSSSYGRYLTPAQFRAEFAPSQANVTAIQQWLRRSGFTVDYTPANNLYVAAEGTVAQAAAAFGTSFGTYRVAGQALRAPERALSVPAGLPHIDGVIGLDDSAALVRTYHIGGDAPPSPAFVNGGPCSTYWAQDTTSNTNEPTPLHTTTTTITSPASVALPPAHPPGPTPFAPCGYTPAQLRGAYGLTSSDTGSGQTVAIIDAYASPTIVKDANTYFSRHNDNGLIPPLSAANFQQVVAPGTFHHPEAGMKQDPQGWYGEESLDVEAVHMMAPGADIVFVGAPNNFQDLDAALLHVVDRRLATLVSNSYGFNTELLPPGFILPYLDIQQQAVAEGIGVYFSSGDSGDETGGSGQLSQATPDWPASSPWVTAVGGTSLAVDASNARTGEWGWETGKSKLAGSSPATLSWAPAPPGKYLYGSGGGTSRLFGQPSYQAGVVPTSMSEIYGNSTPRRVVPDVSALGDPSTGMLAGQTQTFPDGSVAYSEYRIGGTSVACPLFTGMMADVQALRGSVVGFANPLLYANAGSSAYNDILPATGQAVVRSDYANSVDSSQGYLASVRAIDDDAPLTIHVAAGYDDVTGVGSPGSTFFATLG
jgi:subtilase family serine protease